MFNYQLLIKQYTTIRQRAVSFPKTFTYDLKTVVVCLAKGTNDVVNAVQS